MKTSIGITLAAVCLLAVTKPSRDRYVGWAKEQMATSIEGAVFSVVATPFIEASTKESDYVVLDVFETKLDDEHTVFTLGIMGRFIPLQAQSRKAQPAPHIVAADGPGRSHPEDGYVWVDPSVQSDTRVRWMPGRLSLLHSHVVAAPAEEHWLPADGYVWVVDPPVPGDFRVAWRPGRASTKHAHLLTAATEGLWVPEAGFRWAAMPPRGEPLVVPAQTLSPQQNADRLLSHLPLPKSPPL